MTQDQWLLLALKIVLPCAEASIIVFVVVYWLIAPWWRNPLGRTIVIKDLLLAGALGLVTLSLFLDFNRLTSRISSWIDVVFFAAITPVMLWRTVVFARIHRDRLDAGPPADDDSAGDLAGTGQGAP